MGTKPRVGSGSGFGGPGGGSGGPGGGQQGESLANCNFHRFHPDSGSFRVDLSSKP